MKSIKLLFYPDRDKILPENYLRAAGECITLMIVLGFILTYIFNPAFIESNPIKSRAGYNNFCIGFDMPPSSYFCLPICLFGTYFAIQYNKYDKLRTKLSKDNISPFVRNFSIISNNLFIFSIIFLGLCLLITPEVNIWIHTGVFFQIIIVSALVVIANYLEHPKKTRFFRNYTIAMAIFSVTLIANILINYINYDACIASGGLNCGNTVPVWFCMFVDYTWMGLFFSFSLLPFKNAQTINLNYKPEF